MRRRSFGAALATGALAALLLTTPARAMIYWADPFSNGIGRAANDGTSVQLDFITGLASPCGIAVDGGHVYWGTNTGASIGRANLDGSAVQLDFIPDAARPCGVEVHGEYIYWANANNSIGRAKLDGSERDNNFIKVPHSDICGIAVDDDGIHWAHSRGISRANVDGSPVAVADPNGGFISDYAPFIELPSDARPCGVAANGSNVYWAERGPGNAIGRANRDGTALTRVFITAGHSPCGVEIDETHIYWANQAVPTGIGRAALNGTAPNPGLANASGTPCGVAVDSVRRRTTLALTCSPAMVALLQPVTCSVTAADVDAGRPTSPTGVVRLVSSDAHAELPARECALVPSGLGAASCALEYRGRFSANLEARYDGDVAHAPNAAAASITVGLFGAGLPVLDRKRGLATLHVDAPGPGTVSVSGEGVAPAGVELDAAGSAAVTIAAQGRAAKRLKRRGRVTVRALVIYAPRAGGNQALTEIPIELRKQKRKKKKRNR